MVVLDANILIAFGLSDEPLHSQAHQMLRHCQLSGIPLAAPRLFRSELTAVMRKVVYQQRLTHDQGRKMLAQLLAYPLDLHEDKALFQAAYELAERFNRPRAYDSQYMALDMALAQRLVCDFWTADERLFNAVQGQFSNIHWLGNWPISSP